MSITDPTTDKLVTADEFKAFANIYSPDTDTIVEGVISAARNFVEDYCNISIGSQSRQVIFSHNGERRFTIPRGPVVEVTKVEYTDCDCLDFAVELTRNYTVSGDQFKQFLGWNGYFRVQYDCGYDKDTLPAGLKDAWMSVALTMYEQRGDGEWKLPEWVKSKLNPYNKKTWV